MERTSTRDEVNQLDLIIDSYLPDNMPNKFWESYNRLVQLAKQAGWPEEIHKEYLRAIDERDALQKQIDFIKEILNDA